MTTALLAHASWELYGSDLQLVETATGLIETGTHVVVVLPRNGPLVAELERIGAQVQILDMPVLRKASLTPVGMGRLAIHTARSLRPILQLIRRIRPDAVLVNTVTIPIWLIASRLSGIRPVCHVHEAEADAARLIRIGLCAPLLTARNVVVNSHTAHHVVVDAVPALRSRTKVIYNGVPGPPTTDGAPKANNSLSAEDASDSQLVVLVGRLSPRKGTDVALEAIAQLRHEGRNVRLALAGSAFAGYEWFADQLHKRATEEDLAGAVDFVGYADVWEWFARASVVVVPSRVEPFGNVAVQALLAERPLVASRTQGLAEIVRDGETGLSVAPNNPVELAAKITELLDNPKRAATLAAAGRKDALERFDPARYRRDMARVTLRDA